MVSNAVFLATVWLVEPLITYPAAEAAEELEATTLAEEVALELETALLAEDFALELEAAMLEEEAVLELDFAELEELAATLEEDGDSTGTIDMPVQRTSSM